MSRNLELTFRSFKESIITLAKTRSLNITPGIYAEIRNILKSFESIKIDNIFLADTEAWRRKYLTGFNPAQSHEAFITLINQGEQIVNDIKRLDRNYEVYLQEDEIRINRLVIQEKLRQFEKNLHPYMSKNYAKIKEFTVNGGYFKTVHRSELYPSLNKQPHQHENYEPWADRNNKLLPESRFKSPDWKETAYALKQDNVEVARTENRASSTNKNNAGWYFPNTKRFNYMGENGLKKEEEEDLKDESSFMTSFENVNNQNGKENTSNYSNTPMPLQTQSQNNNNIAILKARRDQILSNGNVLKNKKITAKLLRNKSAYPINRGDMPEWKKDAIEAGIRVDYQGTTEHAYHYGKPQKEEYKNFVLNPQVDMTKSGLRPFTIAQFYPISTEYSDHYKFPDHTKVDKFPWIKKF